MTGEEFEAYIRADARLAGPVSAAAGKLASAQYGTVVDATVAAALVAAFFPIAQFILVRIGLPWLNELRRYSELHRRRFHDWIDGEYSKHNRNADAAEAAGDKLLDDLQAVTDADARKAWQRLADLMAQDKKAAE